MRELDLAIINGIVVHETGTNAEDIGVCDGKITIVSEPGGLPGASRTLDVQGLNVLPGIVNSHVHVREPRAHAKGRFRERHVRSGGGGSDFCHGPTNHHSTNGDVRRLRRTHSAGEIEGSCGLRHPGRCKS